MKIKNLVYNKKMLDNNKMIESKNTFLNFLEEFRVIKDGNFTSMGKLKGVFNMKNTGRPSLVLNHNKTPFHRDTLKHTDIGTALRSLGNRLFSHELILK